MKLTGETKLFLGIIAASLLIVVGGAYFFSKPASPEPAVPRDQLVTADADMKGNASASAYLVEFSDFQCPACRDAKPYVDAVTEKHKDNLLFVYRHFPLEKHTFAQKAAIAAEAAGKQGKFWEAYDYLFTNQDKLSDDLITGMGSVLGLNADQFSKDLQDDTIIKKVLGDQTAGTYLGINGTPTFYLNGRKLTLYSFTDLEKQVSDVVKPQ